MRPQLGAIALIAGALVLAGCTMPWSQTGSTVPALRPTSGPVSVGNGESAEQASRRLFPEAYQTALSSTLNPQVLEGAQPGPPAFVSQDYRVPGRTLVAWVLPNDARSVAAAMFAAMSPSAMDPAAAIVPMVRDGAAVGEFEIHTDDSGNWIRGAVRLDPLPGGRPRDLETATAKLTSTLGTGTAVRPTIFLPSGLVFAVGNNGGHEAAVYLGFVNGGPGIKGFHKDLPERGTLFLPAELTRLLAP